MHPRFQGSIISGSRQNQVKFSEAFDNAAWSHPSVTVTADAAVAPDGNTTADLVYPTTTGTSRFIFQSGQVGTRRAMSVYAKAAGKTILCIFDDGGAGAGAAWFDLSGGTVGTVAANYAATILSVGNGWYRCGCVRTSGTAGQYIIFGGVDADNSVTSTTSGTNGVYLWGAQDQTDSFVSPYISTGSVAGRRPSF